MPIYEYQFGVFVQAENEQDAWEQVREISQRLDKLDVEGDSSVDGPHLAVIPEHLATRLAG